MRKIPTLFVRDPDDLRYVTEEVTPGCEWVLAGEGVATRKYDGTCLMFDGSVWWARREVKPPKSPPPGFELVEHDGRTLKSVGWEPVSQSPFYKVWAAAKEAAHHLQDLTPGTYELVGPKINGNPEREEYHRLIRHADAAEMAYATANQDDAPGDAAGFWQYMEGYMSSLRQDRVEGIVWHHPDGRMAKLKVKDFPR